MGQITIYLDDERARRAKEAARAAGVPVSRWLADLVEEKTRTAWPESVRRLSGAWSDFPELEAIRKHSGSDRREAL